MHPQGRLSFKNKKSRRTEAISSPERIIKAQQRFHRSTKKTWCVCADESVPSLSVSEKSWYYYLDAKARNVKIRYITEITEDNIEYCNKIAQVAELRHLVVTNKYFEITESGYMDAVRHDRHSSSLSRQFDYVVYSNAKKLVNQQQAIFDRLWNMAIPCEQRFRQMESEEMDKVDTIQDREHADLSLLSKVKNARSEIIGSVSSLTFLNQLVNAGLVDNMKEAKFNGVNIFLLCPPIPDYYKPGKTTVGGNDGKSRSILDIEKYAEVRYISGAIEGNVFVFDDNEIFMISTGNRGAGSLHLSSRNKTLIRNFTSLFESFWNEREILRSITHARQSLIKSNTQLLSANEQLKVNHKLQKEFINIAAHELRTPIQPILGAIENIEIQSPILQQTDGKMVGTITKQDMQILFRNVRRLEHLSNDILYTAQIDSGIVKLNKAYFDLNVLIENAIKQANQQIEVLGNKVEINYQHKQDIIRILADEDKISKVISNLLDNAIKFIDNNDGTILVNLEVRSDGAPSVLIAIKDSGTGLDEKIMPRLFTKFSSDPEAGGTGLGLYISMKLVEAHGGKIWAEKNADGKGATFFFTLPLG